MILCCVFWRNVSRLSLTHHTIGSIDDPLFYPKKKKNWSCEYSSIHFLQNTCTEISRLVQHLNNGTFRLTPSAEYFWWLQSRKCDISKNPKPISSGHLDWLILYDNDVILLLTSFDSCQWDWNINFYEKTIGRKYLNFVCEERFNSKISLKE